MTKEEKKKMLKAWREEKKQQFEGSLPMSHQHFEGLFDYLDAKLEEGSCGGNLTLILDYLGDTGMDEIPVLDWLRENGGYCDCEVLTNVEEKFHYPACAE